MSWLVRLFKKHPCAGWFAVGIVLFAPCLRSAVVDGAYQGTRGVAIESPELMRLLEYQAALVYQGWWRYLAWLCVVTGACTLAGTFTALILTRRRQLATHRFRRAD